MTGSDTGKRRKRPPGLRTSSWALVGFLGLAATVAASGPSAAGPERDRQHAATAPAIPLWGRFETQVLNTQRYANPFTDVVLNATFTSPSQRQVKCFGFHDGDAQGGQTGHVWKLRFMPDEVGEWSYQCAFSDGTPGTSGTFRCVKAGARPGPLRADPENPRYWVFADGSRFSARAFTLEIVFYVAEQDLWKSGIKRFFGGKYKYNLCQTTYMQGYLHLANARKDPLLLRKWPAPGQEGTYVEPTFNGFFPFLFSGPRPLCDGGSNVDYTRPDLRWMRHTDLVLQELEAHQTVWFNHTGFLGFDWAGDKIQVPPAAEKEWIRYFVARFGPYWNVLWNIAGEWNEFLTLERLDEVGTFVKQLDPWKHPLTTHAGTTTPNRPWVDFRTQQYDGGNIPDSVAAALRVAADYSAKPVFAHEICWEGTVKERKLNADQVRTGAWGVLMGGGFYNYAESFGPTGTIGDGGAFPYVEIMNDFLYGLEYWKLEPAHSLVNPGSLCLANPNREYVVQRQGGGTITINLEGTTGTFTAEWLNPRTGVKTAAGTVRGVGRYTTPDAGDWVLHLRASAKR
ncbi:MAG: DUF5060 domain-containing protein [Gemmataceae bacterium]|nr:DUF5060 domain-containing protein [Gemmataceae bacterium]